MPITLDGTAGITNDATDLNYTGTLTGGTGVINIGFGQLYKDASGNVGIGTSSPTQLLHVHRSSYGVTGLFQTQDGTGNPRLAIYGSSAGTTIQNTWSSGASNLIFANGGAVGSGVEAMRIDSSGYLKLAGNASLNRHEIWQVTANAYAATIGSQNATAANCYGLQLFYNSAAPNNTSNEFLACRDNTTVRAELRSNGGIANFSGNNVNLSDRREKTNFAPAGEYLSKICAIPVQTFNYIDQNHEEDPGLTLGVVAQDVQEVAPELVMESNWGTKEEPKMRLSVYQTDLQYALMKCIQEQQAIITSQTAALQEAVAEINSLKARVEALEGAQA